MVAAILAMSALGTPTTLMVPDYEVERGGERYQRRNKTKAQKRKKKVRQQRKKSRGY